MTPDAVVWYLGLLVTTLGAYRVTRAIGWDDITEGTRRRALDRLPDGWRDRAERLAACGWCLGFWVSLTAGTLFLAWPEPVTVISAPFAIATGVGFARARLDAGPPVTGDDVLAAAFTASSVPVPVSPLVGRVVLANGTIGTVAAIDGPRLTIVTPEGRVVVAQAVGVEVLPPAP